MPGGSHGAVHYSIMAGLWTNHYMPVRPGDAEGDGSKASGSPGYGVWSWVALAG